MEFDDEVWVLDYKLSDSGDAVRYREQMLEYRGADAIGICGKNGTLRVSVCGWGVERGFLARGKHGDLHLRRMCRRRRRIVRD